MEIVKNQVCEFPEVWHPEELPVSEPEDKGAAIKQSPKPVPANPSDTVTLEQRPDRRLERIVAADERQPSEPTIPICLRPPSRRGAVEPERPVLLGQTDYSNKETEDFVHPVVIPGSRFEESLQIFVTSEALEALKVTGVVTEPDSDGSYAVTQGVDVTFPRRNETCE